MAYQAIRQGLKTGPACIQVAAQGQLSFGILQDLRKPWRQLLEPNGPIWFDSKNQPRCRVCNAFNLDFRCLLLRRHNLRLGQPGSTRTAAELAKALPVFGYESSGDSLVLEVDAKPALIISTPSRTLPANGYAAIVILDGINLLSRDSLRATEDAVRIWSNAIALLKLKAKP
jgi:primosomal protein N' (replication factor Y)